MKWSGWESGKMWWRFPCPPPELLVRNGSTFQPLASFVVPFSFDWSENRSKPFFFMDMENVYVGSLSMAVPQFCLYTTILTIHYTHYLFIVISHSTRPFLVTIFFITIYLPISSLTQIRKPMWGFQWMIFNFDTIKMRLVRYEKKKKKGN